MSRPPSRLRHRLPRRMPRGAAPDAAPGPHGNAAPKACTRRVDPSMSENRKVSVPVGSTRIAPALGPATSAGYASAPRTGCRGPARYPGPASTSWPTPAGSRGAGAPGGHRRAMGIRRRGAGSRGWPTPSPRCPRFIQVSIHRCRMCSAQAQPRRHGGPNRPHRRSRQRSHQRRRRSRRRPSCRPARRRAACRHR